MELLRVLRNGAGGCLLSRVLGTSLHRQPTSISSLQLCQKRTYCEARNWVQVERDNEEGIAVVKLDRKPVNSLSKDFMTEINITFEKLENDSSCRGVILTSATPGIFSAGLDITEMYQKTPDYTSAFWRSLQEMWLRLYGTDLATIAAINGHSPAGGCLMAMSCDYRIMAQGKFTIGLNEVHLGIVAPFWFQDLMCNTTCERAAELALQLGTLYKPEEALKVGMIDKIAPLEEVVDKAREELLKFLKIPDHARVITKGMRRQLLLDKLRTRQEEDIAFFSEFINKEAVQNSIGRYLASLKAKKK